MGDVFKLVFFVAAFMPQFSYATVEENHGQLVMWRSPRSPDLSYGSRVRDIALMDFSDMLANMAVFRRQPFEDILKMIDGH